MIRMKRNIYMTIGLCYFAFAFSGCSEKDEQSGNDSGTKIEGIALSMDGSTTEINAETRANVDGVTYVINTSSDPTYSSSTTGSLVARGTAGWKLDLNIYNGKNASGTVEGTPYTAGSFTGGTYDTGKGYWIPASGAYYFPNYYNPQAEAWLYPAAINTPIATDQSTVDKLVAQDILYKAKGVIAIAHTPTITLNHKRTMLDFIVSDVIKGDIAEVTVLVGSTPMYKPYLVKETTLMKGSTPTGAVDLEYMLILPEGTTDAITVQIETNPKTTIEQAITYKQKVTLDDETKTKGLISNACYCFKLQGNLLTISPVTITDWTTGKPVTGEYLGVTEYPTFKGAANETWYLYFDNKLTEPDGLGGTKAKLQTITFNNEGECTIKPDGRIITHIFKGSKPTNLSDLSSGKLATPIVLNNMYITLP